MTTTTRRRLVAATTGLLAAGATLTALPPAASAGPAVRAGAAAPETTDAATLTWGISGYAQEGIFGPWRLFDLTGDTTLLAGSVSGGEQTDYIVDPVPATSMPVSDPQQTPNAVEFDGGDGSVDPLTGAVDLVFDGSYTVNAYPEQFNAPDEIYADPELVLDADGDGTLTMQVTIGAGEDMDGEPTPPLDLGRLTVATFSDGSVSDAGVRGFRVTPDYQDVEVDVPEGGGPQETCAPGAGVTGWWGSWPQDLVTALPDFVRPHFYSTGCGGRQDYKPALPIDIGYGLVPEPPVVTVSQTAVPASGQTEVTVEGSGFDPSRVAATRPPLAGSSGGMYVAFGAFAADWRPSTGATGGDRPAADVRWAVLAQDMATIGGAAKGAVELTPQGTFETTLLLDRAAADEAAAALTDPRYGIYTYPGGGATLADYETYTPVTFQAPTTMTVRGLGDTRVYGRAVTAQVSVASPGGPVAGRVQVRSRGETLTTARLQDGVAAVPLPRRLAIGTYPLRFVYAGAPRRLPAAATRTIRVTRAPATLRATVAPLPLTTSDRAQVRLAVGSKVSGVRATGRVRVRVAGVVRLATIGARGRATVRLPRLSAGQRVLRVTYFGGPTHQSVQRDRRLLVRR